MVDLLKLALKYIFDVLLMVWIHFAREVGMSTYALILSFLIQSWYSTFCFLWKSIYTKFRKGRVITTTSATHNFQQALAFTCCHMRSRLLKIIRAPLTNTFASTFMSPPSRSQWWCYKKIMRVIGFLRNCSADEVQSPPPRRLSGVCWQLLCSRLLIKGEKIHRRWLKRHAGRIQSVSLTGFFSSFSIFGDLLIGLEHQQPAANGKQ